MEIKDYYEECGVDECYGGLPCLKDNGKGEYCNNCLCKFCTRGKCWESD